MSRRKEEIEIHGRIAKEQKCMASMHNVLKCRKCYQENNGQYINIYKVDRSGVRRVNYRSKE